MNLIKLAASLMLFTGIAKASNLQQLDIYPSSAQYRVTGRIGVAASSTTPTSLTTLMDGVIGISSVKPIATSSNITGAYFFGNGSKLTGIIIGSTTYLADGTSLALNGATFSAKSSSVTLQGNTFNAANKLVQLNGSAQLPAIDGSLLTGLSTTDSTKVLKAGDTMTGPLVLSTLSFVNGVIQITPPGEAGNNHTYGISIGSNTYGNRIYGLGIGYNAFDNYDYGVGLGYYANDNYTHGVGVGDNSRFNYSYGVGLGYYANNNNTYGVGIGAVAQSNANYAVGVGAYSKNNAAYGSALGAYSYAASSSVALGSYAKANAETSIAIGNQTVNNSTGTASFGSYGITTSSNVTAVQFHGSGAGLTSVPNSALVTPVIPSSATGTYPLSISGSVASVPASGVDLSTVTTAIGLRVLKAGDTMSGPLTLTVSSITAGGHISATAFDINGSTVLAILGGTSSMGIGKNAGKVNTGEYELFVGEEAGAANVGGVRNLCVGYKSCFSNINGSYNSALGAFALGVADSDSNIGIGYASGYNYSGQRGIFIGSSAGYYGAGNAQIAIGYDAAYTGGGIGSVNIGYRAGREMSGGNYNTFIGYEAGYNVTTGSGSIIIGDNITADSSYAKRLNIGNLILGDMNSSSLGVTIPASLTVFGSSLTVNGAAKVTGAMNFGSGVLVSTFDALGNLIVASKVGVNLSVSGHGSPLYALDVNGGMELHQQAIVLGSATIAGADGLGVTYGINAGSITTTGANVLSSTSLGGMWIPTTPCANSYRWASDGNGNMTCVPPSVAVAREFYLTTSTDGPTGFTLMTSTVAIESISTKTYTVSNGNTIVFSTNITPSGFPNLTSIPAGAWQLNFRADSNRLGYTSTAMKIYHLNGTSNTLFTFPSTNINTTTPADYTSLATVTSTAILSTDRLMIVRSFTCQTAPSCTMNRYYGSGYYNDLDIPAVQANPNSYVPVTGSVVDVDLGNYKLYASSASFRGSVTVSSLTVTGSNGEFGVRISSNIYVVGYSSAAKYYGDGSALTNITGFIPSTATGNYLLRVATATYLATDPGACGAGEFIKALTADGTKTCAAPSGSGDVVKASTQTFTGGNIFQGASTFTATVNLPTGSSIIFAGPTSASSSTVIPEANIPNGSFSECFVASTITINTQTGSRVNIVYNGMVYNDAAGSDVRLTVMVDGVLWGPSNTRGLCLATMGIPYMVVSCPINVITGVLSAGSHSFCLSGMRSGGTSPVLANNVSGTTNQFWVREFR